MKRSELEHMIWMVIREDLIPGGKGDDLAPESFDQKELKVGIAVEREHTDSDDKAQEIAIDHLSEDPKYYTKLIKAGLVDEKPALIIAKKVGLLEGKTKLDQPIEKIKEVDYWTATPGNRMYKMIVKFKNGKEQILKPVPAAEAFGLKFHDVVKYRDFVRATSKMGFEVEDSEFDVS